MCSGEESRMSGVLPSAMAAAYNMYNEARLAPVWPLSPHLVRSCALAGVRAMQLASPLKSSEIERELLGRRDYHIRDSSSSFIPKIFRYNKGQLRKVTF